MAPQVLIIGGGPSGLFAACELARHGIAARLIERELVPHRQARGTSLQPATLEVLDRAGILEPFLQAGVAVRQAVVIGPDHQPLSRGRMDQVDTPWPFQCCLPQWRTEALLTARLESLGGKLEHGVSVTAVQPGLDGVRVELRHHDGREEVLDRLSWLIDASGAHSLTRASLREELEGETYPGHYLVAEAGERFVRRWRGRVEWCDGQALGLDPGRAGVPHGGAVLIRPDGFIGFRALPAAEAALAALDAHLSSWLRPA